MATGTQCLSYPSLKLTAPYSLKLTAIYVLQPESYSTPQSLKLTAPDFPGPHKHSISILRSWAHTSLLCSKKQVQRNKFKEISFHIPSQLLRVLHSQPLTSHGRKLAAARFLGPQAHGDSIFRATRPQSLSLTAPHLPRPQARSRSLPRVSSLRRLNPYSNKTTAPHFTASQAHSLYLFRDGSSQPLTTQGLKVTAPNFQSHKRATPNLSQLEAHIASLAQSGQANSTSLINPLVCSRAAPHSSDKA